MKLIERLKQKPEGKYFLLYKLFLAAGIVCALICFSLALRGIVILMAVVTAWLAVWLLYKSAQYQAEELAISICRQAIEDGRDAYWDPKYPRPVKK